MRTTVSLPDEFVKDLEEIVSIIKKRLPQEFAQKVTVAKVVSMIVTRWILEYRVGKRKIDELLK